MGAYWGPCKETALECARRTELFFHMLARCDPSFVQWYRAGRGFPRELPGHPVNTEVEALEKWLLQGRSRMDVGKHVIEDMGFRQSMWNAKKAATDINIHCGMYTSWAPSSCLLKVTRESPIRERLLRVSVPPLPAPVRIEPVGTLGWLLVLSPEPMTAGNPEHVAFTARVRELLDRAGLIAWSRPEPVAE